MKKLNKFTILLFTIAGMILLQNSFTVTIAKANSHDDEIVTYSDILEWRYKVINGKLYKRQYNRSKNEWVGKWILV